MGFRLGVGELGYPSLQHGLTVEIKHGKGQDTPKELLEKEKHYKELWYQMSGLTTETASQISSAVTATRADGADGHLSLAFNIACCP